MWVNIRNVTSNFTNHNVGFLIFTCVKILNTCIADGRDKMACDGFADNVLECVDDPRNGIICVKTIISGTIRDRDWCPNVPTETTPNKNCTKEIVRKKINDKCNGKSGKCVLFKSITEISEYCKGAMRYVLLNYECGE